MVKHDATVSFPTPGGGGSRGVDNSSRRPIVQEETPRGWKPAALGGGWPRIAAPALWTHRAGEGGGGGGDYDQDSQSGGAAGSSDGGAPSGGNLDDDIPF